jgi:hypothetical protein
MYGRMAGTPRAICAQSAATAAPLIVSPQVWVSVSTN